MSFTKNTLTVNTQIKIQTIKKGKHILICFKILLLKTNNS